MLRTAASAASCSASHPDQAPNFLPLPTYPRLPCCQAPSTPPNKRATRAAPGSPTGSVATATMAKRARKPSAKALSPVRGCSAISRQIHPGMYVVYRITCLLNGRIYIGSPLIPRRDSPPT